MSEQLVAALVAVTTYAGLRLVDYLLPTGRRFRFLDRFTRATPKDPPD